MAEKPLKVPAKFSVRKEFWNGFGVPEAVISAITIIIVIILAFLGCVFLNIHAMFGMLFVMLIIVITFTALQKFDSGISMVDYLKIKQSYKHSQQKFMYKYKYDEE